MDKRITKNESDRGQDDGLKLNLDDIKLDNRKRKSSAVMNSKQAEGLANALAMDIAIHKTDRSAKDTEKAEND